MKGFFLITFGAVLLVIGLATSSHASSVTFTDITKFTETGTDPGEDLVSYGGHTANKLEGLLDHVCWTHHFEFNPLAEEVLSGTLTVWLKDDWDPWLRSFEFALGWTEDGIWDLEEVNTGAYTYSVTASSLEDGAFTVTLASLGGDFYINQSDLTVTYTAVPLPTTLLLLASGLVGLVGLGRRKLFERK